MVLVWRLGRAVFGNDRVALGAAWIFAFEPISVNWSVVLLAEPLFLVLLLLSMERLAVFLLEGRLRVLAAAGFWLAAATFVRPITYYLPIALALGLFLVFERKPGLASHRQRPVAGNPFLRWKAPAVLLICVAPWLAAWQIRNRVETGYGGFSSVTDENLYLYIAPFVTEGAEHRSYVYVRNDLVGDSNYTELWLLNSGQIYLSQQYLARHPEQSEWNQGQRLAFMHSQAIDVIRAHYGVYLGICLKAIFRTLFELGEGSFNLLLDPNRATRVLGSREGRSLAHELSALAITYPWIAAEKAAFGIVMMGLYLLAVRGVFRSDMRNARLWMVLGISLYFIAVSGFGSTGSARYRCPIMPVVCILAAAGIPAHKGNRGTAI